MGGVPRSKGCGTCRRKKIKCDEQRPSCGQCRKGVRVCEGYDRPLTFKNQYPTNYSYELENDDHGLRFNNKSLIDRHALDQIQASRELTEAKPICQKSTRSKRLSRNIVLNKSQLRKRQLHSNTLSLPRCLSSQLIYIDQILGDFLDNCLPLSSSQEVPLSWLRNVVSMDKEVDSLPLAMAALAVGWAGHVDSNPELIDKGLQLYNAAVIQLRVEVQDRSPLQVLATSVICTVYELFEFGSEAGCGWLCHMAGIAATLRAIGPEKIATEPYLQIYGFCRIIYVVHGIKRRRRICAGSPMWAYIPYQHCSKSEFQQFLDLGARAAELLEEVDILEQSETISHARKLSSESARHILCQLIELIQQLKLWEAENHVPLINGPSPMPQGDTDSLIHLESMSLRGYPCRLPSQIGTTFDSLQGARLMHLYWAVLLTLYMTILDNEVLRNQLDDSPKLAIYVTPKNANGQIPIATLMAEEAESLADSITTYGHFCCQNLWQSFGTLVSTFSLETAAKWYSDHGSHTRQDGNTNIEGVLGSDQHIYSKQCSALLAAVRLQSEEFQVLRDFQSVTFNSDDVLRYPWC
ncbi:hypothetical protein F5B20DRAFT_573135 [Whalleya microplaca]|nr:hypothetical protein F5B20DRAFT_573135 [Whalleya microplaca]